MTNVRIGLTAVIVALVVLFSVEEPVDVPRAQLVAILLLGGGVAAVLIGVVSHIGQVERAERERSGSAGPLP